MEERSSQYARSRFIQTTLTKNKSSILNIHPQYLLSLYPIRICWHEMLN